MKAQANANIIVSVEGAGGTRETAGAGEGAEAGGAGEAPASHSDLFKTRKGDKLAELSRAAL